MHGWGETNTGLKGPDIGWMPLSAKEAASIESLGGVFHNRRRTMEDFSGEVCQISVAFGFVDAASSPSDKKIVAHPMFIGRRRRGRIPLYPGISRYIPAYLGSFFLFAGIASAMLEATAAGSGDCRAPGDSVRVLRLDRWTKHRETEDGNRDGGAYVATHASTHSQTRPSPSPSLMNW